MRKTLILICLFTLFLSNAFTADFKHADSELVGPHKSIKIGTLDNGIKYYIKQNKEPENRMVLRMPFKIGSIHEDDDQLGLAHFIEHMAFNGTKHFPKNDIVDLLEKSGVRFGADLNAHTWFEETVYKLRLPTDDEKLMNDGFQIFADWASEITFDHEEIDKERGVIMEEWRLRQGARNKSTLHHLPVHTANSRFAKRYTIGDTAIIQHAPYDVFKRFYKDWYRPDMYAVIAVGDFDVDDVEAKIKKYFSGIKMPANPRKYTNYDVPATKGVVASVYTDTEITSPTVEVLFKGDWDKTPNYGNYRKSVLKSLWVGMFNQRLQELSQKAEPPYKYAYGYQSKYLSITPAFILASSARTDDINHSYTTMLEEFYRAVQHGFTDTEIERQKKSTIVNYENGVKEIDKTDSRNYAEEFLRNFLHNESIPGIEAETEIVKEYLKTVSNKDLMAIGNEFVKDENICLLLTAPKADGVKVPIKDELIATFKSVSSKKYEPYVDNTSSAPLFSKKVKSGKITATKENKDLGITEFTLSNGAKVVLKPTDFKNNEINFSAWSFGGSSTCEDDIYMSAENASSIVNMSGIAEFDNIQLRKKLSGKDLYIYPYISELSQGISGQTSKDDLETFFQLLHLQHTAPRLDDDAIHSFKAKQKEGIKDGERSPYKPLIDSMGNIMSGYDLRAKPLTVDLLEDINNQKALEFYKKCFNDAGSFTYFFVGAIDIEKFKPLIEKYIASLPSGSGKSSFVDRGVRPPKGKIKKEIHKGKDDKSYVRLVITGDTDYDRLSYYNLKSMCSIMSIKLRELLREEKGGVYGVGCYPSMSQFPYENYQIVIAFGCEPKRVEEMISDVKVVIKEMKNELPSDENMTKITNKQRKKFETDMKSNRNWIGKISSAYYNNFDVNIINDYLKWVDGLNKETIKKTANQFIDENSMKTFILYPSDEKAQ